MKKLLMGTAVTTTLLFTGCAQNMQPAPAAQEQVYVDPELQGAPAWVLMPMVEGTIAEVGSAKKNAGGDISFQRNEAMADARDNLAKLISVKVKNMFKSFKSVTSETYDKASESVSKQIASQTLNGTEVKGTWISKTGTLYVLMAVNTDAVSSMMEKTIKSNSSFKNDPALYQKFLASKAQGELDAELEKAEK